MEVYEVIGARPYQHHNTGERFAARLQPGPRRRALLRGDIRVVEPFTPTLPQGYKLPPGWADRAQPTEAPEGASSREREQ